MRGSDISLVQDVEWAQFPPSSIDCHTLVLSVSGGLPAVLPSDSVISAASTFSSSSSGSGSDTIFKYVPDSEDADRDYFSTSAAVAVDARVATDVADVIQKEALVDNGSTVAAEPPRLLSVFISGIQPRVVVDGMDVGFANSA